MLTRILAVTLNTYRESARARVLHALFALALFTGGYSLVVGEYASRSRLRVVSDLGAASISLYCVAVAIVLGATSLYREVELKTIFPILARPIHRAEYLIGKYLGIWVTLMVFALANCGALLFALSLLADREPALVLGIAGGMLGAAVAVAVGARKLRSYLPIVWSPLLFALGIWLASPAPDDRAVLVVSSLLTLLEVGVVAAIATLFSSFTSPMLTAVFTGCVFILARSAETLANMPEKMFGSLTRVGEAVSAVLPDLAAYVPPRPLLIGAVPEQSVPGYLLLSGAYALCWVVGLMAAASFLFRRRDFL